MKTYGHPKILKDKYICPDYKLCKDYVLVDVFNCEHNRPHPIRRESICVDPHLFPKRFDLIEIDDRDCLFGNRYICKLRYCREATQEDEDITQRYHEKRH
jgi:hypothetical protein